MLEVIGLEQTNKNQNTLSALSYFSVFFAPIILPILVWILAEKPTSTHGRKALFNHIWIYISLIIADVSQTFTKEIYQKPFDNPDLIFNIFLGIAIIFYLLAFILFVFNIIRGIKLLTDK